MLLKKKRIKVYKSLHGHCAYCGTSITYEEMTVDHIIPQCSKYWKRRNPKERPKEGEGKHSLNNLLPACKKCNSLKGNYSVQKFKNILKSKYGISVKKFYFEKVHWFNLLEIIKENLFLM